MPFSLELVRKELYSVAPAVRLRAAISFVSLPANNVIQNTSLARNS